MESKVIKALEKAGKPMKSIEIAEFSGLDKKEVYKAVKSLKAEEKIFSPKRCY